MNNSTLQRKSLRTLFLLGLTLVVIIIALGYFTARVNEGDDVDVLKYLTTRTGTVPPNTEDRATQIEIIEQNKRKLQTAITLAAADASSCLSWVQENIPEKSRNGFMRTLIYQLADENPEAAIKLAMLLPHPTRDDYNSIVIDKWGERDPVRLVKLAASEFTGKAKSTALLKAVQGFSERNLHEQATAAVLDMPYGSERSSAIGFAASSWLRADPSKARAWILALEEASDRLRAGADLVRHHIGENELDGAMSALNALNDDTLKQDFYHAIATKIAGTSGRKKAEEWIGALDPKMKAYGVAGLALQVASQNAAEGYALAQTLSDTDLRFNVNIRILSSLFADSPKKAADWLQTTKERSDHSRIMMNSLVAQWYNQDSIELSDWINGLPKGGDRDNAISSLVGQLERTNRELAYETAKSIQNDKMRNELLKDLKR